MHFVLSYDLSADGERRTEIEKQIQEILSPHRNVKPLSTFYVIHVKSNSVWDAIRQQLTELSRNIPERLRFVMSPLMDGGMYDGILPKDQWNEINAVTGLD